MNAAANTPIAFPSFVAQPAASVTQNAGTFTLVTPGTYLVTAVLNPPPSSALATDAVLRANGTPISSTQTRIANGDNAASYTLQTLVTVDRRNDRQPDRFRRAGADRNDPRGYARLHHIPENRINAKPARQKPSGQLVDISKPGLNRKVKKFSDPFVCGKGYSPPIRGENSFLSAVCPPGKRRAG